MSLSELQGAVQAQCFCHDFPKGSSASQVCALLIHSLGVSSTPAMVAITENYFQAYLLCYGPGFWGVLAMGNKKATHKEWSLITPMSGSCCFFPQGKIRSLAEG